MEEGLEDVGAVARPGCPGHQEEDGRVAARKARVERLLREWLGDEVDPGPPELPDEGQSHVGVGVGKGEPDLAVPSEPGLCQEACGPDGIGRGLGRLRQVAENPGGDELVDRDGVLPLLVREESRPVDRRCDRRADGGPPYLPDTIRT